MEINILQTHIAWMVRDGESDGIRVIFYSHLSGICHCCATHTKRVKWGKRMVEFHQMIFLLDSCLLFKFNRVLVLLSAPVSTVLISLLRCVEVWGVAQGIDVLCDLLGGGRSTTNCMRVSIIGDILHFIPSFLSRCPSFTFKSAMLAPTSGEVA